jgi:hypothetical protein
VRDRFREDAERYYDQLFGSLTEAIDAEITRWGDCPNCHHRVPVTFPDVRARTKAIEVLLDQGYGRPVEKVVRQNAPAELDSLLRFLLTLDEPERNELRALLIKRIEDFQDGGS